MAKGLDPTGRFDAGLHGISLFRDLPPNIVDAVAKRCSWRRFGADQIILGYHEDSTDIFFVAEGKVRVSIYAMSGKEVTFRDIDAGEFFGEFAAIDGKPRSANVVAVTDALVAVMSGLVLWEVLEEHPPVAAFLLKHVTAKARALSERVYEYSALSVRNRIHAELLRSARRDLGEDNKAVISPAPTHAEIASRVGTHREAVSRELSVLARDGLIERQGRTLLIHDMVALERMVDETLGE